LSATSLVAYLEAEYFGGVGQQRATVWAHGSLALGPLTEGDDEDELAPSLNDVGARAKFRLDEARVVIGEIARWAIDSVTGKLPRRPDKIGVEFGIKLTVKSGKLPLQPCRRRRRPPAPGHAHSPLRTL
jgi:Trypsin-co-occurring domain 1